MNRLKHILVGVDFSPCSKNALIQAAWLARWNNAKLHVLYALDSLVLAELLEIMSKRMEDLKKEVLEQETAALQQFVNETLSGNDKPEHIVTEVKIGAPLSVILDNVAHKSADLLVLGTHGVSTPEEDVGSLAMKCVRKAPTKVMLVRPGHDKAFKKVVAAVDFSENSRGAVEQAVRVSLEDKAELHIVNVYFGPWNKVHYFSPTKTANPDFIRQYTAVLENKLKNYIDPFVRELNDIPVTIKLIENQNYADGVNEYLKAIDADLVVTGTRGQSNLSYVLLGGTAQRIIRHSSCSVLAIKPRDFQPVHTPEH